MKYMKESLLNGENNIERNNFATETTEEKRENNLTI